MTRERAPKPCRARLPLPARLLLRLAPLGRGRRAEVHDDLHELFAARRNDRGSAHAHWRLYRDLASLWAARPHASATGTPRPRGTLLQDVHGDLRYAVRLFARQPAILVLTIVGLSLGLGIATAAVTIMNAALRGEGLVDSDRAPGLLRVSDRAVSTTWRYDEFAALRDGAARVQVEAVLTGAALVRSTEAEPDGGSAGVGFVSGGFFAATGGRVALGRPLEPADERFVDAAPVVVSFGFWTSRLGRDPAVIGRTMRIGRRDATIVGVAQEGFSLPHGRMLWMPLTAYGAVYDTSGGDDPRGRAPQARSVVTRTPDTGLEVFGRLLPGVALAEAEAQLSGVAAALRGGSADGGPAVRVRLDPHAGLARLPLSDTLAIGASVFAVIALVLLLACANVATVLISSAITREREMAVRAALGASRWRVVRQLVTESLALSVIAAAVGLLLVHWTIPMIGTMIEAPPGSDLSPDLSVFLFLGLVTVVTAVTAGLAPAWHGGGVDLVAPLKGEGAHQRRVAPRRLRSALVITQAGASVVLIVLATLFVHASVRGASIDVGYDAAGLYTVSPGRGTAIEDDAGRLAQFWARAAGELEAVPGIAAVTLAERTPFDGISRSATTSEAPARVIDFTGTQAAYFETLGLRILAGRTYTPGEVAARASVAVVSESLARAYWGGRSPLGEMLPAAIPVAGPRPVVIGVVSDAITARLHQRNTLAVYDPLSLEGERIAQLLIRVAPGASGVVEQANQRLRAMDADAEISITSVTSRLRQEANRPRMLAVLTGVIGLVAITLCVIGLYGLTASVVGQRAREMAVRAAIGAGRRDLLRLLMWDSLRPVMLGLVLGSGAALLAGRLLVAAMFFGVSPRDPVAFGGAAVLLLTAAMLAVIVPTRRAARVDAASVLRRS